MLEILVEGEKKKVACGPCIRGHRSSKCNHKDRLLIEVRKPGRPLSACPHPAGSCKCDRLVLNYTIPKSSECPCPSGTSLSSAVAGNRVSKARVRKQSTTVAPSNLKKAIDEDPSLLSQHTVPRLDAQSSISSDTSGSVASIPSSNSSTPRIDAVDSGTPSTPGSSIYNGNKKLGESEPLRLGMLGVGGYGAARDDIGWSGDWPSPYGQDMPPPPLPKARSTVSSCCQPKVEEESNCCEPSPAVKAALPAQSSCCGGSQDMRLSNLGSQLGFNGQDFSMGDGLAEPFDITPYETAYNSNIQLFGHTHAPGLNQTLPLVPTMNNDAMQQHNCQCGDGCQCLGCATHPRNGTTMGYVLYHGGMMMMQPQQPRTRPLPPYTLSQTANHLLPTAAAPFVPVSNVNFPGYQYEHLFENPTGLAPTGLNLVQMQQQQRLQQQQQQRNWIEYQQPSHVSHTPTVEFEHFNLDETAHNMLSTTGPAAETLQATVGFNGNAITHLAVHNSYPIQVTREDVQHRLRGHHHGHDAGSIGSQHAGSDGRLTLPYDIDSPPDEDAASTLSPSSYYMQTISIQECEQGSCSCESGCDCPGCLEHRCQDVIDRSNDAQAKAHGKQGFVMPESKLQHIAVSAA